MTRLVETDINTIAEQLWTYDHSFRLQTGHTMEEVAKEAAGISGYVRKRSCAVVSITGGMGIISGFAQAVTAILKHCGAPVVKLEQCDAAGIQQAYLAKRELVFLADDNVCAAFGIGRDVMTDNGEATGQGYAAALILAMKVRGIPIINTEILIIGAGSVGAAAAGWIAERGAVPVIYDIDQEKAGLLAGKVSGAKILTEICSIKKYPYIIDASTAADLIDVGAVTAKTIIAAPGMPCAATAEVRKKVTVIHNPLELGIMTMYFSCLKKWG